MAPKLLEDLPGVGPATAEKLREAGFNSVEAIAVASPGELVAAAEVASGAVSLSAGPSLEFDPITSLNEPRI